jgi:hypothetical protein
MLFSATDAARKWRSNAINAEKRIHLEASSAINAATHFQIHLLPEK